MVSSTRLGLIIGAAIGYLVSEWGYKGDKKEIRTPISVIHRDVDGDGLMDIVERFADGADKVLYRNNDSSVLEPYKIVYYPNGLPD